MLLKDGDICLFLNLLFTTDFVTFYKLEHSCVIIVIIVIAVAAAFASAVVAVAVVVAVIIITSSPIIGIVSEIT